jgi:hypothetical protein
VTLKRCPATRIPAVRGGPADAVTSNGSAADPLPAASARRTIQFASGSAVQGHRLLDALTSTRPDPPDSPKLAPLSASENEHSAAACVTSTRCSLRTTAPRRTAGSGLGIAANSTAPSP